MQKSYKQLVVWQRAMELVNEVYGVTKKLPPSEQYGLVSQMRRCAISIPSNVAEGYKRKHLGEYVHFLTIAEGSSAELETQLLVTKANYPKVDISRAESLLIEVQKMLYVLIKRLRK